MIHDQWWWLSEQLKFELKLICLVYTGIFMPNLVSLAFIYSWDLCVLTDIPINGQTDRQIHERTDEKANMIQTIRLVWIYFLYEVCHASCSLLHTYTQGEYTLFLTISLVEGYKGTEYSEHSLYRALTVGIEYLTMFCLFIFVAFSAMKIPNKYWSDILYLSVN